MIKEKLKNVKNAEEALTEISRLETLFLKKFKRKTNAELVIISTGFGRSTTWGIQANIEENNKEELNFFKQNL